MTMRSMTIMTMHTFMITIMGIPIPTPVTA